MVSFRHKLTAGLRARDIDVTNDLNDTPYDAVLVIGGTRDLPGLWRAKRGGIAIIQRLDGMNWLHKHLKTGLRHYLRAEYGNLILSFIRRRLVTGIVYQSQFSKDWWERVYGPTHVPNRVVYNAVDLDTYSPDGAHQRPTDVYRILLVEGSLQGGYEMGLVSAVQLAQTVASEYDLPIELMVAGKVDDALKAEWDSASRVPIHWAGQVDRDRIPELDRSAHLLYSGDLNAACPNAVIEALACGLPVLAYDTGALPELVSAGAGRIVPYGGDPWQLDPPDIPALAAGAVEIIRDQERRRDGARHRAESDFGLDQMVTGYIDALVN
jgi:glycosyltransferase involved in cell wall biosynthesis